jgi:hypothetical protein
METEVGFEEILRAWLLDYNGRVPSKPMERTRAFIVLLRNLGKYNYGKQDLNKAKKEKIIRSCVNPNHYSKSKLRTWIDMALNDLENAIQIHYGSIKIDHTITPEEEAKLSGIESKALETRSLKTPDKEEGEEIDNNKPLDLDGPPLDLDSQIRDAVENPSIIPRKTFEITDEMLNDIDEPQINWDEDFNKRLGLDDDK